MNNLFRGLIAGYGAKKLGGGCFSTILVFIVLWVLLGQCDSNAATRVDEAPAATVETAPATLPVSGAQPLVPAG